MTRAHVYTPPTTRDRTPAPRCCAACIRGTRALQGPCARNLNCPCHTKGPNR